MDHQLMFTSILFVVFILVIKNGFGVKKDNNNNCAEAPQLRNGNISNGSSTIGSNRTIICLKGFYLSQIRRDVEPLAFCEKNSKWLIKARCLKVTPDALMTAMIDGEVEKLEHMLLQNTMSISILTFNNGLVRAAENGHFELVVFLVTRLTGVVDVNARSEDRGYTALISAAKSNNTELIKFLLDNGADAGAISFKGGSTALKYAAFNGNVEAVRLLLKQAPSMASYADLEGFTPLHFATNKNRSVEIVQLLLDAKAEINALTSYGTSPLLFASRYGNYDTVRLLLERGANVEASDIDRATSLHFAALNCREDLIDLIVDHGASVNARNNQGHTAIMMAVMNACPTERVVRLLAEHGADLFTIDDKGFNLLMLAGGKSGNYDTVKWLVTRPDIDVREKSKTNVDALLTAAYYGQSDMADLLLEHGANVESRDHSGATPLISAAKRNHLTTVDLLLKRGADVNAKMKQNWTALMFASEYGWVNIVRRLVSQPTIDINAVVTSGRDTALTLAARNCQEDVVKLLLEQNTTKLGALNRFGDTPLIMLANDVNKRNLPDPKLAKIFELIIKNDGTDVNAQEIYGSTALNFASRRNLTLDVLRVLIKNGADVNSTNVYGASPLSWAVANNRDDAVRLLLDYGADVNMKTAGYYGHQSLLIEAVLQSQVNIVRLLVQFGADLKAKNDNGMTAIQIAMRTKGRRPTKEEREILKILTGTQSLVALTTTPRTSYDYYY